MINDLSETLRAILSQPGLPTELSTAQVVFDRPSEAFKPSQTSIDLFLYDIRENTVLRSNERYVERSNSSNNGAMLKKPALRVDCSYLLTAWPVGGQEQSLQEHMLLGQALHILSKFPQIPKEFLKGSLKGQEPLLPMMTAKPDGIQNPSEFWTALGNQLKPSISISVTIAMEVFDSDEVPTVLTSRIDTSLVDSENVEKLFRIAGVITDADDEPLSGVTVKEVSSGIGSFTKDDGTYMLKFPAEGSYKLIIEKGSLKKEVPVTVPALSGNGYDIKLD